MLRARVCHGEGLNTRLSTLRLRPIALAFPLVCPGPFLGRCPPGRGELGALAGVKIFPFLLGLLLHSPRICQQVGIGLGSCWRAIPIRLTHSHRRVCQLVPVHTPPCPIKPISMFFFALCLAHSLSLPACMRLLYLSLAQAMHAEHSKESRVACRLIDPLGCKSDWRIRR